MSRREQIGRGLDKRYDDTVLDSVRPPTPFEETRARRAVVLNAHDAGEAAELLAMLGLMPARKSAPTGEKCAGTCGRTLRGQRENVADRPNTVRVYARKMCAACWHAAGKPRQHTKEPVRVTTRGVPCAGGCGRRVRAGRGRGAASGTMAL